MSPHPGHGRSSGAGLAGLYAYREQQPRVDQLISASWAAAGDVVLSRTYAGDDFPEEDYLVLKKLWEES